MCILPTLHSFHLALMKRLLILLLLFGSSISFAQTVNCVAVKAENTALKDKIATYEARLGIGIEGVKTSSGDEKFGIKFLSCKASKSTHKAILTVLITNLDEPANFNIWTPVSKPSSQTKPSTFFDEQGQGYSAEMLRIGSQQIGYGRNGAMVPSNIPVQCTVELVSVPLSVTRLVSVMLSFGKDIPGMNKRSDILTSLQNLPVTWIP